uniref:Protein kinase domain-containing protein n=1 Tax=Ananas comosus var. bracteatus TaxID=296719 RepID=A0A6V7Q2R5_ANACO|nr:unnamed protein product [Ananas comosus var. bracteatus]
MLLQLQLLLFLRLLGLASAAAAQQTNPEIGSNCSQTCGPPPSPTPSASPRLPDQPHLLRRRLRRHPDRRARGAQLLLRPPRRQRAPFLRPLPLPRPRRPLRPQPRPHLGQRPRPRQLHLLLLLPRLRPRPRLRPASASACAVPAALLRKNCGGVSCYYSAAGGAESPGFLAVPSVADEGCGVLVTSLGYEPAEAKTRLPALVFETAELGWWLDGSCRCSDHANCTQLISPYTRKPAFYCSCFDGFYGDGFSDGLGCRKVGLPKCSASKYVSGGCGGRNRVGLLVGGMLSGAAIMAVLAGVCLLIRRRSSSLRKRKSTKRLLSEASCAVPLFPYKDIEKATNGFSEEQRLGTGAYGTVYAGKLSNDKLVAIKKIKQRDSSDSMEQVMNEIKLLSSVSHPNLVRLLGCCIERGEQILVYEFMPNGTLAQHLQRERGRPPLPWTVRLTIAMDTAKAIAYLHSAIHPPIYTTETSSPATYCWITSTIPRSRTLGFLGWV